jgi:hypothetical protein
MAGAQATAGMGSMSGLVTDSSGAAVAGAQVVVSNPEKGIKRDLITTNGGLFVAPALVPASGYQVSVTKQGFAPYQATGVTINVGENADLHLQLKVGAVAEKVDVSATAIMLDDSKTEQSSLISNQIVNDLPTNGRRIDQYVILTPAVTKDADFGLITFRGMAGGNGFLIDGVDTTNQYYNENAGRTRINAQISPDAVQEFQVLTSSYSAEFGGASGGTMNTVTKSGTNGFHGSVFEFFRNRTLDAIDRYSTINANGVIEPFNPPEKRNQFGGTVGGPIMKDKLFFFFNEESQRRTNPIVDTLYPSEANVNSNTQTWIGCTVAAPQCTAINALLPHFYGLLPRTANQDLYFLKLDYRPNDRNSISVSFNYLKFFSPDGIQTGLVQTNGSAVGTNGDDSVRDRIGRASWTYVPYNNVVNEFRFGWFKDRQADDFNAALQKGYAFGNLEVSVSGGPNLGAYTVLPRLDPSENRFQYVDNLSWVRGRHDFKFGASGARTEDYTNQLTNRFGTYSYSSVNAFAEDYSSASNGPAPIGQHYSTFTQEFGNPIIDTKVTDLGLYAQDTWKPFSKLTINYGVRYEYSILPQPTTSVAAYPETGKIPSAGKNFAPRVGVAFAISSKNVLRLGYGIFYDRYETGLIANLFTGNGIYQEGISLTPTTGGPIFPNILPSATGTAGSTIMFAAPNMRNPYSEQANIGIEHQFTKNTTMTLSYIRNRAKRMYTVRDLNIGPLSTTIYNFTILNTSYQSTGQIYSTPIYLLANRVDKNYLHVDQVENGGKQWYDAGVMQLNHRFGHNFTGTVSYTWSHELDEDQEAGSNELFFSSGPIGAVNGNYTNDKGNGQLDQRQRFITTFTWSPKPMSGNGLFAKYIANNWQWNGILTLASGRPAPEYITWSSTTNLPQVFTGTSGSLNGLCSSGCDNRVPWLPNNPLMIDPITRFDTRISKIIPIKEKMALTLSFEVFNLTNTISNTGINETGYTAANKGSTTAPNFVIAPCTNANPTSGTACTPEPVGQGNASAGFPDGTNARRAQVGIRFIF